MDAGLGAKLPQSQEDSLLAKHTTIEASIISTPILSVDIGSGIVNPGDMLCTQGHGASAVQTSSELASRAATVANAVPEGDLKDLLFACWQAMERYAPLPQPLDAEGPSDGCEEPDEEQLLRELMEPVLNHQHNDPSDSEVEGEAETDSEAGTNQEDGSKQHFEHQVLAAHPQPSTSGVHSADVRQVILPYKRREHPAMEEKEEPVAIRVGEGKIGFLPPSPLPLPPSPPSPAPPLSSAPEALQTHLDRVAASLIKRQCTVPMSDPVAEAYGSACRDAVQL